MPATTSPATAPDRPCQMYNTPIYGSPFPIAYFAEQETNCGVNPRIKGPTPYRNDAAAWIVSEGFATIKLRIRESMEIMTIPVRMLKALSMGKVY